MQINNLIKIYFHVCNKFTEKLCWEVQRFSNNNQPQGIITDEELITIYLFCVAYEEKYKLKSMYNHIKNYWQSWFPLLPSYQAFNARLNRLCSAFAVLLEDFVSNIAIEASGLRIVVGDSFPVVTCSHKRAGKVARELADKGYCATKKLHFYGVKVHAIGLTRPSTIPYPQYLEVTQASVHDLTASRNMLEKMEADVSVFDKAYADSTLAKKMLERNNLLLTPLKDKQGLAPVLKQREQAYIDLFSKAVSTIRQPIESLFNWINELTQIQKASKVRSANGLRLHLFGKLTAAVMVLSNF